MAVWCAARNGITRHSGRSEIVNGQAQAKTVLISKIFNDSMRQLNDRDMEGLDKLLVMRGEVMPCPPGQYTKMAQLFERRDETHGRMKKMIPQITLNNGIRCAAVKHRHI